MVVVVWCWLLFDVVVDVVKEKNELKGLWSESILLELGQVEVKQGMGC